MGDAERIATEMERLLDQAGVPYESNHATWVDAARALLGGHSVAEVDAVMRFARQEPFWDGKVRGVPQLVAHYGELRYQAQRGGWIVREAVAPDNDEIRRRVAHYRRNIAGGTVEEVITDELGNPQLDEKGRRMLKRVPYLAPEEVDRLCDKYERTLGMKSQ